ncbi:unnamed protein product [Orchesella dallaii]|uniref:Uncharacterized protein n=1 Tax=Orchesella dallaii TaxID=48710 RepID=A0ABP1Q3W6_9HEXA
MSAEDEFKSVFTPTTEPTFSRSPILELNNPAPAPPLISAEQQWLSSVSPQKPYTLSAPSTKESSDIITLQPPTPSQLAARERMKKMQEEIREVLGVVRLDFNKCLQPDRRLSELYHVGEGFNLKWKCRQEPKRDSLKKRFRKRLCCLILILVIIATAFVGDYWGTRWVIQHEIKSELAESMLAKQQIESRQAFIDTNAATDESLKVIPEITTTRLTSTSTTTKKVTEHLSENKVKAGGESHSQSSSFNQGEENVGANLETQRQLEPEVNHPQPVEYQGIETERQAHEREQEHNVDRGQLNPVVKEQDPFASLQGMDIGSEFPRGHDVLDLAMVDSDRLPLSQATVVQESLWRPKDEEDVYQEQIEDGLSNI